MQQKFVNIVRTLDAPITEMESETVRVTNLDASITEMNLTVQYMYSFQSSDQSGHGWCGQCGGAIIQHMLATGIMLAKKFNQPNLTEKGAHSHKVFARYMRQILYVLSDFQVSERFHRAPESEFSHTNYLIDYIMISPQVTPYYYNYHRKVIATGDIMIYKESCSGMK